MKTFLTVHKTKLLFIALLVVAIGFRFYYLDRIPNAISGDELLYDITAKSIALTGHDITGTWNPFSAFIFRYPPNQQQAELPYFLLVPFSGLFPFSLLAAKLPFATLSVGIVILMYATANILLGEPFGIAIGFIAAINPWLVVMGRTGYESTPATFFYLLGIYTLLIKKGRALYWSLIPFLLAFYSYIGTKLIFVPFVFLASYLAYYHHKKQYLKNFIGISLWSVIIVIGFALLLKISPTGSRISEIFLPNSPIVATQVNGMRQNSMQSSMLPVVTNKYSVYLQIIASKLFRIFSPSYLFVDGDQFFLPVQQSFFYYVDSIFLLLGFLYLYTKNRRYFFIVSLFAIIGTFPHLFHKTTGDFSGHLALMFPFLIIVIGTGIASTIQSFRKFSKTIVLCIIGFIYLFSAVNFLVVYFNQTPRIGYADFQMRVLSKYLQLAKRQNLPIIIYSNTSADLFKKYLFYTDSMNRSTMPIIRHTDTNNRFTFDKITFSSCENGPAPKDTIAIYDAICDAHVNEPHDRIARLSDGGSLYQIVHDKTCMQYPLNPYPIGVTMNDFKLNQLSEEHFCMIYAAR